MTSKELIIIALINPRASKRVVDGEDDYNKGKRKIIVS